MPIPARAFVALLLAVSAACSGDDSASVGGPTATPTSTATAASAPTARPTQLPSRTTTPAPRATPGAEPTPGEPDFSGTGCFPSDPPVPVEVTTFAQGDPAPGERVRIVIEIRATERVTVEHRHGQEIDASVDRDGREIWRWSTVAPFTDPYGYTFVYEPGEVRRFSVVWDGGTRGDYTLHGFLIADMQDPPPQGRFICFDDETLRIA